MLATFLKTNGTVAVRQTAGNREEAIFAATTLLLRAGIVTDGYYHSILANMNEHGPYFVLVPGFAMPHAQPGPETLKLGFSLVTLAQPVCFGHAENDPVDVLVCIAAPDRNSLNEDAIAGVMSLIDSDETLDRLRSAKTTNDVFLLLDELAARNGE